MAAKISILEAIKIQARAVIPIVKALELELGKERAHALVRDALARDYAQRVASRTPARNTHPREGEAQAEFPVTARVVADDDSDYAVDMTSCRFAEHFRAIGEPEIGALLTCGVDFAVQEAIRPSWELRRTQTQMQGAAHCDFRWSKRSAQRGEAERSQTGERSAQRGEAERSQTGERSAHRGEAERSQTGERSAHRGEAERSREPKP